MTNKQFKDKMQLLGVLNEDEKLIPYGKFKNLATISRYGKSMRDAEVIVYIGLPNKNLIGLYVKSIKDTEVMKEAYGILVSISKGNSEHITDKTCQWSNCDIPRVYEDLKII